MGRKLMVGAPNKEPAAEFFLQKKKRTFCRIWPQVQAKIESSWKCLTSCRMTQNWGHLFLNTKLYWKLSKIWWSWKRSRCWVFWRLRKLKCTKALKRMKSRSNLIARMPFRKTDPKRKVSKCKLNPEKMARFNRNLRKLRKKTLNYKDGSKNRRV